MSYERATFLVTGGAGLVGSTLVDQLLVRYPQAMVRVIDNLTRGTMLNLEQAMATGRVEFIRADISDYGQIRPHFDGVDVVFHQAAIRITRCAEVPRECLDVLVVGTFNVAQACVEAGVKRLIAASSASVYGMASHFPTPETEPPYNNRTWYGAAKMSNELMLRSFFDMYRLPYVALRYFNVYGPRMDVFGKYTEVIMRWLDCLEAGTPPKIYGDGSQTMDFIYVDDVARANILAMESQVVDDVFNVGSGNETSLRELLDLLLQITGNAHVTPEYLPERTVNSVRRRLADCTKAWEVLGFKAQVPLEEGLRRLITWRQQIRARGQQAAYEGACIGSS